MCEWEGMRRISFGRVESGWFLVEGCYCDDGWAYSPSQPVAIHSFAMAKQEQVLNS